MDFRNLKQEVSRLDTKEFDSYREFAQEYVDSELIETDPTENSRKSRYLLKIRGVLESADDGDELAFGLSYTYQTQADIETLPGSVKGVDPTDNLEFEEMVEHTLGRAYDEFA